MPNRSSRNFLLAGIVTVAGLAGCGSATDDRPAKWSFISAAIVQPSCATASCHSELAQRANVDLHSRQVGYEMMVTKRNFAVPGTAGQPQTAALSRILRGQGAQRMPPDFALPIEDIELIEKWIAAGAKND
jgi:hypothetical protein